MQIHFRFPYPSSGDIFLFASIALAYSRPYVLSFSPG